MNITVTITLAPEVLEIAKDFLSRSKAPETKSNDQSKKAAKAEPKEATTDPAPETKPSKGKATGEVTAELVRSVTTDKIQGGRRTEVKALLEEFGADKLSALDQEHYADFYAKVSAL